jgi:RHS repeat-associated protein
MTKISGDMDADVGFSGNYYHKASGLLLTLYRAYDANLGRWLSRDPIGEDGGMNLYGYVLNNPINLSDPFELCVCDDLNALLNQAEAIWNQYDSELRPGGQYADGPPEIVTQDNVVSVLNGVGGGVAAAMGADLSGFLFGASQLIADLNKNPRNSNDIKSDLIGLIPHLPGAAGIGGAVISLAQTGGDIYSNYIDNQYVSDGIDLAKRMRDKAEMKIEEYYDELKMYNCPMPNPYPNGGPG